MYGSFSRREQLQASRRPHGKQKQTQVHWCAETQAQVRGASMAVPLELLKTIDLPIDTSEEVFWFCL